MSHVPGSTEPGSPLNRIGFTFVRFAALVTETLTAQVAVPARRRSE